MKMTRQYSAVRVATNPQVTKMLSELATHLKSLWQVLSRSQGEIRRYGKMIRSDYGSATHYHQQLASLGISPQDFQKLYVSMLCVEDAIPYIEQFHAKVAAIARQYTS
jgi:hypothetical protein